MRKFRFSAAGNCACLATVLVTVGLPSRFASGEEAARAYHRILVPAEAPSTWSTEGEEFLPIESREFDGWIAAANERPATAEIEDAEYEVKLIDGQLVDGRGTWQIVLHGLRPARLALGNLSMLLADGRWRGDRTSPARLGWWPGGANEPLSFALEVPRSGKFDFAWSAKSVVTGDSELRFPLSLPVAARTRLIVEVPAGKRPVLSNGIVLQAPLRLDKGGRWVLAVAPSPTGELRFEEIGPTSAVQDLSTAVTEDLRYELSKRGIELDATLRFDQSGTSGSELNILLPAAMQLISATAGDEQLKWRVSTGESAAAPRRATIQLPIASSHRPISVALRAWGPLVIDERIRLPMLLVDDAFWTAGTTELSLDEALELRELSPIESVQTAAEVCEAPGERRRLLRFAAFSPSAAVDLLLAHRPMQGNLRMGTALEVGNPGVVGRLVAEVNVEQGSLYKLAADLRPGWSLDAVETIPADAIGEWYVDRLADKQEFVLQLDRAVTADHPVKLIVTARLPGATALKPLTLDHLIPLVWNGLTVERNLLQLRAAEQYELQAVGPLQLVAADDVTPSEQGLIPKPTEGLLCDLTANDTSIAVRLAPKKGDYTAAIQIDESLSQGQLRQSYYVDCRPVGSGIDHVLVYLSEPPSEPLRWTEANSQETFVAERMPADDPRLGGLPPGGELWRLDLRRLYARPISLTASWSAAWPNRHRVPLVSLPDAATQQGRVSVASAGNELPAIVPRGLTPTPLPAAPTGEAGADSSFAVHAVYRFQPTRFYDAGPAPELWLGPPPADREDAQLLATQVELESRIAADGAGVHRVRYHLENRGAKIIELKLPQDVQLETAHVDGQPVPAAKGELVSIPLTTTRFNTLLELELSSRYPPLSMARQLLSPLPTGAFTILDGQWQIQLPEAFTASDDTPVAAPSGFDWRKRLFGPLARQPGDEPFNPLSNRDWNLLWAGLNRIATAPAEAAVNPVQGDLPAMPGWHSYQIGFAAVLPSGIAIAHIPTTRAASLAVFLLCAAGATLLGFRIRSLLPLALAAAAISLLVSTSSSPLVTGATLGFLAAALWQWLQLPGSSRPTAILLVVAGGIFTASSQAAPTPVPVERVLVPVDSAGKQVGTKYFVGTNFLRQLISASKDEKQSTWYITGMRCEGELGLRQDVADVPADRWIVTLELDVLARDTNVRLPLVQQEAEWSAAASLDGMPATIDWDDSGQGCTIRIADPGPRRLSISFSPNIERDADQRQISLRLPPVPGATVRIACPVGCSALEGDELEFSRHDEPNQTVWQCELAAPGRLAVHWSALADNTPAEVNRRVDELLWLRVADDGIALDARYKLRNAKAWPTTIDVTVDDGWEFLPPKDDRTPAALKILPEGRQMLRLHTALSTDDSGQLVLRFRRHDRSPFGRLRPPAIQLSSLPLENRWLAVTWDGMLDCVPSTTEPATGISPGDFAMAWPGRAEGAPQLIVSPAKLGPAWFLAVRTRAELSSSQDQLSLSAGEHRLRVDYRSEVVPSANDRYGWSLNVPNDLEIQSVQITAAGAAIPLDWVRESRSRVQIFFATSIADPFEIQLVGNLPMMQGCRVPLPRIGPAGQTRTAQTISLYRDDDVLANWHFPKDTASVASAVNASSPFGATSRFVRAYAFETSAVGAVEIVVTPNRPVVHGNTLTTVSRDNGIWAATASYDLSVEQGELDTLSLEVPTSWAGPFDVTPSATAWFESPRVAGAPAILSIRLPQSVAAGGAVKLQIHSPLLLADGELPSVPRIVMRTSGNCANYLSLPKSLDDEQAAWTRVGIEPAALPPTFQTVSAHRDDAETFRIHGDALDVALRPRGARAAFARVRLAETVAHFDSQGGEFSVTRFIISPAGLAQCVVALPVGDRLVRATLDGHSALVRALDEQHWEVQLGPPSLPQTLDVVTRAVDRSEPTSRRFELRRPALEQLGSPIPVDLGLWTLDQARSDGAYRVAGGARVTPAGLAATRLDRLVSISQSTTQSVIELPLVDGYSWFARWSAGLDAAEQVADSLQRSAQRMAETVRVPQQPDQSVSQSIARSDAWTEQIAEIFAATGMAVGPLEPVAAALFDPWRDAASGDRRATCYVSDGDQTQLLVEWVPDGITEIAARCAALASLATLALATFWLVRKPALVQRAENRPEAVGVILGIAMWAWLRPSGIGLALAVGSLFLLFRRYYREKKSPRHDSTNQPSSIPKEMA